MNEHKDYRVTVRVRNNNILKMIEGKGISGTKVAKDIGMSYATLSRYIQLRDSPIDAKGAVKPTAQRLCDYFGMLVEEVWSLEQLTPIECNSREVEFSYQELTRLENISDPVLSLENDQLKEVIDFTLITKLTPREAKILKLRFGFEGDPLTLEQVGDMLDIGRERVRQIEAKALRKLRHPTRLNRVRVCLGEDEIDMSRNGWDPERIAKEKLEDELAFAVYRNNKEQVDED
jgi:RNA polymerase sigma factor (sigma-70 family)